MYAEGKRLFAAGENVVEGLSRGDETRRRAAIEIAYSLQSGEYTRFSKMPIAEATRNEGHRLVEPILKAHAIQSILDCGAGEGTRWFDFAYPTRELYCLDASFHRMTYCRRNIERVASFEKTTFIKGNMTSLPFAKGSVDAVFTCHAVEPNSDADAELILRQIFAIARKLVILLEPNYRDADPDMRARMEMHGYARNIWDVALAQPGFELLAHGTLCQSPNPLNKTSYLIFKRTISIEPAQAPFISPIDGNSLHIDGDNLLVDQNLCFAFPIVQNIYCLAIEDGIFVGCNPCTTGSFPDQ